MSRGIFVAIEGIDGSGKSTVATRVVEKLNQKGYQTVLTAEPTKGETGLLLRERLKQSSKESGGVVEGAIDAEYFFADRIYHNHALIKPKLESGIHVVSDRYDLSTLAYQSTQGVDMDYLVEKRDSMRRLDLIEKPTMVILLDVSVETALKRLEGTKKTMEKFEDPNFLTRLKENYFRLYKRLDDNMKLVDAERGIEDVVESACDLITQAIENRV